MRCTCGTSDWEWEDDPDAWHADHWRCPGCERRERHYRRLNSDPSQNMDGVQVRLFKTPREG